MVIKIQLCFYPSFWHSLLTNIHLHGSLKELSRLPNKAGGHRPLFASSPAALEVPLRTVKSYWPLFFTLENTIQRPAPNPILLSGFVFIWHYTTFESGFTFINIRQYCWRGNACEVACNPWTKQTLLSPSSLFTRHGRMEGWKDQRAEQQQYLLISDSISNTTNQGQNTGHHKGQIFGFSALADFI